MLTLPKELQIKIYQFDPTYHVLQHRKLMNQLRKSTMTPRRVYIVYDNALVTTIVVIGMILYSPFLCTLWVYNLYMSLQNIREI